MNKRYKWRKLPQEIISSCMGKWTNHDPRYLEIIQRQPELTDIRSDLELHLYPREIKTNAPQESPYLGYKTWIPFELIEPL